MKKPVNIKKVVLPNLPYVFIALFATKLGQGWRLAVGGDFSAKILYLFDGLAAAFQSVLPSFHPIDLCVGIAIAGAIRLAVYFKGKNAKKFRKNMEYGTARWGTPADIAPFVDPKFENNIILTRTESLMMSNRPKDPKTARNKNVLIVGGSGSGKTRFWLKPNLMQCMSTDFPTSFVVTDPKGSLVGECGKLLLRNKYKIKIFNTINFKKSMHYNPFAYIHSEKDILKLVTTLISNTKGEGKSGDDFWVKAETLLYTAIIGLIWYEAPEEEKNFTTLIEFINASEVREDDENFKNNVDLMFEKLEAKEPNHFAVRQYKKYKLAAGKTAKSILVSCGARLAPFDIQELRDLTAYDELELDTLGDYNKDDPHRKALFLIMSDTDSTFNFLISMIYTQLFNLLCEKADDVYGGRLQAHVRCLIDEAANIGQIPNLEKLVATIRSREISACLVLQAQSQLKALYKDNADTIIGNMDSRIFLGGSELTTLKELSAALGKETIDTFNTGESRGRETSHSLNYQKLGKELASVDELSVLDGGKCILQLRGVRPFLSDKYDITQHPNYKYLSDYDERNAFRMEKYLSTHLKPKPEEVYDVYEVDVSGEEQATA
ncbi:MAG: type IV secretory system conjugative DNA transfer family protein [Oscillospiraceae bacterium]|nr:type IV secretory system conjugative DNA transfer family protein [Oscillospiraceae bacterium]